MYELGMEDFSLGRYRPWDPTIWCDPAGVCEKPH